MANLAKRPEIMTRLNHIDQYLKRDE